MILTKKQEIEELKAKHAKEIRKELKDIKIKSEQDSLMQKAFLEQELKKFSELETANFHKTENQDSTIRSEDTRISKRSFQFLDKLNSIQKQAKDFINSLSIKDNFPEPPALGEKSLVFTDKPIDHIRIPILVPRSFLRKSQRLEPPTFNHITKNGEVLSVRLLTESMPTFDPLTPAEAKIPRQSLGSNKSIIADISHNIGIKDRLLKSVSPIKPHKSSSLELSPPEGLHTIRELTPVEKVQNYSFRDCGLSEFTNGSHRSWVSQRMKTYAIRIKELCKPQTSLKKQLEMDLLKEKHQKAKPFRVTKVKLGKLSHDY